MPVRFWPAEAGKPKPGRMPSPQVLNFLSSAFALFSAAIGVWILLLDWNPKWQADARFEAEEVIVSGNRAVVPRVYRKMRNGQPWHLRGVDVFAVHDGKVAAKLAYVKG